MRRVELERDQATAHGLETPLVAGKRKAKLARKADLRGVALILQAAIYRYITDHKDDPRPVSSTKSPDQILAKLTLLNASVY